MIRFPCKCGHIFELPEDRAGDLEQCPVCSRLNDIPTLSDLTNLSDDGTFLIEDPAPPSDQITLGHLHEAFAPGTVGLHGEEIDYRRVAADPLPLTALDPLPTRTAPRYDPATGELIRPLELDEEPPMAVLLVEDDGSTVAPAVKAASQLNRPRALRYATETNNRRLTPVSALLELMMPANVTVLFIIFVFYYAAGLMGLVLSVGGSPFLQVLNVPLLLLIAHYGCVIEDLGPDAMDELPRPLRFGAIIDDIFNPLIHVTLALILCFGPMVFVLMSPGAMPAGMRPLIAMMCAGVGALAFPAVVLTAVTGATLVNLRPDRVLGVMVAAGATYILAVAALLVSMILTAAVFWHPAVASVSPWFVLSRYLRQPFIILPLTLVAVYATHYFCWLLGIIYREHQPQFPWAMQHHVRTRPHVPHTAREA